VKKGKKEEENYIVPKLMRKDVQKQIKDTLAKANHQKGNQKDPGTEGIRGMLFQQRIDCRT